MIHDSVLLGQRNNNVIIIPRTYWAGAQDIPFVDHHRIHSAFLPQSSVCISTVDNNEYVYKFNCYNVLIFPFNEYYSNLDPEILYILKTLSLTYLHFFPHSGDDVLLHTIILYEYWVALASFAYTTLHTLVISYTAYRANASPSTETNG